MPLVNITPKTVTRQAYQVNNADDMIAALKYLVPRGFWGHINVDQTGTVTMGFSNSGSSENVAVGDWIVIENATANSVGSAKGVTNDSFVLMYQTG